MRRAAASTGAGGGPSRVHPQSSRLLATATIPAATIGAHARTRQARNQGRMRQRRRWRSGSVNRWLRPDSVRYMSVTTAMQGLTAAHHETRRDNSKASRESGYAQATGRFRRWWQVLGSNQRRRSRRFTDHLPWYVHISPDLRLCGRLPASRSCLSAICPCAGGLGPVKSPATTDGARVTQNFSSSSAMSPDHRCLWR